MFHYYTLAEIYAYAESFGYSYDDVEIQEAGHNYYVVSFGHEYTEMWIWEFEDLEAPSVDYEHIIWED